MSRYIAAVLEMSGPKLLGSIPLAYKRSILATASQILVFIFLNKSILHIKLWASQTLSCVPLPFYWLFYLVNVMFLMYNFAILILIHKVRLMESLVAAARYRLLHTGALLLPQDKLPSLAIKWFQIVCWCWNSWLICPLKTQSVLLKSV